MSLKPDDLAQVILDSIDDDEPPTALYTLNIHEARMLAHTVTAVSALAETWEEAARLVEALGGDAETVRDLLQDIRAALNGGNK